jgi:hypothetical protein
MRTPDQIREQIRKTVQEQVRDLVFGNWREEQSRLIKRLIMDEERQKVIEDMVWNRPTHEHPQGLRKKSPWW